MLWPIVRKEIVSHVLSLRFGVTFILFILLVFASLYVTTHEYQRDVQRFSACVRAGEEQLRELLKEPDLDRRFGRVMYDEGRLDAVPVPPLTAIAQGLRPFMPVALRTTRGESANIGEGADRNGLAGLMRLPDLVYVVSVVLSLLAILFAFDSVCGEKESGTLRLMLSNAVPRDSILLGKWLGGYVVLGVPLLVATGGGLGYAWWHGSLILSGDTLQRLAVLLGVAFLYVSVFFTLGLFVSTITHHSATSLFVCLLIWVVWILAIPNLAPVMAKIFSPTPSAAKIAQEKRAVDAETRLRVSQLTLRGDLRYGEKTKQEQQRIEAEGDREKQRWDRFFEEATQRQTDLAQTLGRLSPSACWTYAAVALANCGADAYHCFEQGQQRLQKSMTELADRLRKQRTKDGKWPELRAEDLPSLAVTPPDFPSAARKALNDILILGVLNVVFFLGAFLKFLRYDVR